ncbi:MAG: insulinase family protein [Alphaproteobacteria bacterium]|nr:insulinase family protein [Alphaproteobacteria bacterium]
MIRFIFCFFFLNAFFNQTLYAFDIQSVKSSKNNIEAWLVEDHSLPLISIAIGFRGGSALDPEKKQGLALFTTSLLDEGAGQLDATAFQQKTKDLALDLDYVCSKDTIIITFRSLTKYQKEGLALLKSSLIEPRFDTSAIERIRSQLLVNIKNNQGNPGRIGRLAWLSMNFPGHPYSKDMTGTAETIASIEQNDFKEFLHNRFTLDNMFVAVVGDIDATHLSSLLDETFGDLPKQSALPIVQNSIAAESKGEIWSIPNDIPQSIILFGHGGIKRNHPDFIPAVLVNYILGGSNFDSHLNNEIREKRGLTYGISTDLETYTQTGLITGNVATQSNKVLETIDQIKKEWGQIHDKGLTQQELDNAKKYTRGSFALQFNSSINIAQTLLRLQLNNLGINYIKERENLINSVTLKDIKRVTSEIFMPNKLSFVIVGKTQDIPNQKILTQ